MNVMNAFASYVDVHSSKKYYKCPLQTFMLCPFVWENCVPGET